MSPDPAADLDHVRRIALALPRAAERISHGQPVFFVEKGRIFTWFLHDHHHVGITAIAVKAEGEEERAMLVEQDPALYYRPAYLAPRGWIGVRLDSGSTDWDHVANWIRRSWEAVAPRKLIEAGL